MSLCDLLLADVPISAPIQRKTVKRSRQTSQQVSAPTPTASKTSTPPSSSAPPTNVEHSLWPPSSHHRQHTRLVDLHYPLTAPMPGHVLNSLHHFNHIPLDTPVSDNHRKLSPKKGCLKPSKPSEQETWDVLSNKKKSDMIFDRIAEITGTSQDDVEVDDMLRDSMNERPPHMTPKTSSHHYAPSSLSPAPQHPQSVHPTRGRKRFRYSDEDANIIKSRPRCRGSIKTPSFGDHEEGWRPAPSPVTFSGAQVIYGSILANSIGPILESRETKVSFAPDSQEWFIWRTSRPLSAREMRRHRRTLQDPWDRELKRYDIRKQWHNNRRTFKYRSVRDKFVEMTIDNANTPVEIEIATIMLDGLHEKCQAGPVYIDAARAEMAYVVDTLRLEERTNRDNKIELAESGVSFFDPERARLEEAARLTAGTPPSPDLPQPSERPKSVNEWAYANTTPSGEETAEMRRAYLDEADSALCIDAATSAAPIYTAEASVLKLDASGLSIGLNVYPQPSVPLQITCSSNSAGVSTDDSSYNVLASAQGSDAAAVYISLNISPLPTVPMQMCLSHNPPNSSTFLPPQSALISIPSARPTKSEQYAPPSTLCSLSPPLTSIEKTLPQNDLKHRPQFTPAPLPSSIKPSLLIPESQLPSPPSSNSCYSGAHQIKSEVIKSIYTSDRRTVDGINDFLDNLPRDKGAHKELGDDNRWEDLSDGDSCVTSDIDFTSCWDDMGDVDVRGGWDE